MKITSLSASNWKGRTFTDAVGHVTVWSGPNDSGKTARLDAVRTVLNGGYHPDKAKSGKGLGETAELLSGQQAQISLSIASGDDDDFGNAEALTVNYAAERNAWRIVPPVPDVGQLAPLMKSAADFFAMTGPAQTRYIFGLMASDDDESVIVEKIMAAKEELQPRTDKTDLTCDDWIETASVAQHREGTFNEWLLSFAESVNKRKIEVEQANRRYAGFAQTTVEMRSEQERITASLPALEAAIAEKRQRMAELQQRSGALNATLAGARKSSAAKEEAEQFIGDNPIEVLEQRKAELEARIKALEANTPLAAADCSHCGKPADTQLDGKAWCYECFPEYFHGAIDGKEHDNSSSVDIYVPKEPAARKCRDDASLELRRAKQDVEQIRGRIGDLKAELEDTLKGDCCPKCKGRSQKWKETTREAYAAEIKDAETALANATAKVSQRQSELTAAEEACAVAKKADGEHVVRANEVCQFHGELSEVLNNVARYHTAAKVIESQSVDTAALDAEQQSVTNEVKALHHTLSEQCVERDRLMQERGRIDQALRVDVERANGEDELRALKVIAKLVSDYQEESVTKSFRSLLATVNRFTAGIIPERIEFRDGELGRWQDVETGGRKAKQWVCHRAFGQTFQAVTYIGLAVALASKAAFRLVLFDELGVVDEDNIERVITRMIELQRDGVIDQFLGASPNLIGRDLHVIGLKEIELGLVMLPS
jgi:hypothetical protein